MTARARGWERGRLARSGEALSLASSRSSGARPGGSPRPRCGRDARDPSHVPNRSIACARRPV